MNENKNKSSNESYKNQEIKFLKISNQTLYCALSYIYILWIVGLLADKNNKIVKFHVNQGITLFTISFFSLIIINILSNLLYSIAPILTSISACLEVLWLIFYTIFVIIGIKNALTQKQSPLPLIGSLFNFVK